MGFVENLILFLMVQKFKKWFTSDKVITIMKCPIFMDHGVVIHPIFSFSNFMFINEVRIFRMSHLGVSKTGTSDCN